MPHRWIIMATPKKTRMKGRLIAAITITFNAGDAAACSLSPTTSSRR
jgi:hypothetical protein